MSAWAEVRQLQEELYNVQLQTTKNKLSERNCIAVIQRLIGLGWLEVLYSCDGKEYITPQQLEKDILDELYVCGGRVALTDLAQTLNVDYSHIDKKVSELLSHDVTLAIHYGELISKQFFDNLAVEVNETLQQTGLIALAQLSRDVSLPVATLAKELVPRVGEIISGTYDKTIDMLYTTAFIDRQMAKLRGACSAATRPIQLKRIMDSHGIAATLGHSCMKDMITSGRLQGKLQGQSSNPVFIPALYLSAQNQWADSFYKQNGYITFQMMSNKGIDNAQTFVSRFENGIQVPSGCISEAVLSGTQSIIEERISSNNYIEPIDWVYEWCNDADITALLELLLKNLPPEDYRVLPNHSIVSVRLLNSLIQYFDAKITEKVKIDVLDYKIIASLKKFDDAAAVNIPETRSKKGGKGGKKGKKGRRDDGDVEYVAPKPALGPAYLPVHLIELELQSIPFMVEYEPKEETTIAELAVFLKKQLDEKYCHALDEMVRSKTMKSSKSQQQASESSINTLYNTIILCEKSLKAFDDSVRALIEKHILKTLGMELTKSTFQMLAEEYDCPFSGDDLNLDSIVTYLPKKVKPFAASVITSVNSGSSVEEFIECYTNLTDPQFTQILVKKLDKKKERNMVFSQKQALLEQLKAETKSAELLNIACNLIFIKQNSTLLHVPGRCITAVVKVLSSGLSETQRVLLDESLCRIVGELKGECDVTDEAKQVLRDLVADVLFGVQQGEE